MPHQCTNCAREFDDGSKEMLSGCPNCGGNKFQFRPDDADGDAEPDSEPPEPPEPANASSVAKTVGKTAATVREFVGRDSSSDPTVGAEGADAPDPLGGTAHESREDTAQASARSEVVRTDELPTGGDTSTEHRFRPVGGEAGDDPADGSQSGADGDRSGSRDDAGEAGGVEPAADPTEADRPDLEKLRAELNDQFESIKVLSPGHYELNLMELYDREEYIIALEEDGRYSVQVPENFHE